MAVAFWLHVADAGVCKGKTAQSLRITHRGITAAAQELGFRKRTGPLEGDRTISLSDKQGQAERDLDKGQAEQGQCRTR